MQLHMRGYDHLWNKKIWIQRWVAWLFMHLHVPWLHYSMDVTQKLNTVTKVFVEKNVVKLARK